MIRFREDLDIENQDGNAIGRRSTGARTLQRSYAMTGMIIPISTLLRRIFMCGRHWQFFDCNTTKALQRSALEASSPPSSTQCSNPTRPVRTRLQGPVREMFLRLRFDHDSRCIQFTLLHRRDRRHRYYGLRFGYGNIVAILYMYVASETP
jgi:hypothetical protein